MEFLALLVIGMLLGIPAVAVIALVRTGTLRRLLDETSCENRDKFSDHEKQLSGLRQQVSDLRRELTQISQQRNDQIPVSPPSAPAVTLHEPERPAEETMAAVVKDKPVALGPVIALNIDSAQEPCDSQAAIASEPYVFLKQSSPVPPLIPDKPAEVWPDQISAQPAQSRNAEQPSYVSMQTAAPSVHEEVPPRKSIAERLRTTLPLEELLGMNLFAKIGIILLVLGLALGGKMALVSMGPAARVALIYAASFSLLVGGIWLERKERYRIVGRAGIGGGWATLFFTTYSMYHVPAMTVMTSNTLNCVLMLGVAIAMVAHTIRYKSQVVTGLAFLLAFSTVALSQDSVYALSAGVILAAGIVVIALRMSWFELEVFGILASYANHFYWLYRLFPDGVAGHAFPQFWPSAIILVFYWAIFRVSYVARDIRIPRDEAISTIAALLNTMLLGAVMKFQSTRPELAFYGILAIGVAEFIFGQLPVTRRRRPAFVLLTVIGTLLIFASVPFKFSGNNIAFFWMIAAEVLLIAGISQLEVIFRRLGLIAGLVTGLLVICEARSIIDFRQHSDLPRIQDGILLLTCSLLFYGNALFVRRKWRSLFDALADQLITDHSYIGGITAFLGLWCIFTGDWTAISWAALLLGVTLGSNYLEDKHLLVQG